jgi:hypothetical protein
VDSIAGKFENLKMKEQDGTDSKMGNERDMAANIKAEVKKSDVLKYHHLKKSYSIVKNTSFGNA